MASSGGCRRVLYGPGQSSCVLCAVKLGDHHARADGHAAEKAHQTGDQKTARPDGGRGGGADIIPNENQIDRVIELLHQTAQQ